MKVLCSRSRLRRMFCVLLLTMMILLILIFNFLDITNIGKSSFNGSNFWLSIPTTPNSTLANTNSSLIRPDAARAKLNSALVIPYSALARPDPSPNTCSHHSFLFLTKEDKDSPDDYFTPRAYQIGWEVSQFLIQPRQNICSSHLDLLMLVPSLAGSAKKREAIRNTWGSVASGKQWPHGHIQYKVALVFLMGRPVTAAVESEAKAHGDILLSDLHDTYRNLTWKMLGGLKWVSTHCSDTTFVGKIDDDMFLNIDHTMNMLNLWLSKSQNVNSVLGNVLCGGGSRVFRNNESRLYVSFSQYPFFYYPPYVSGGHYVLSGPLVPRLVNLSRYMPVLPIEDAFINGVLAYMLHVQHVSLPRVVMMDNASPQTVVSSCYISAHGMTVEKLEATWNTLKQHPANCSKILSVQNLKTCSQMCKRHK